MIFIVALTVFVSNLPFGFWRGSLRKFSLAWFAAIHIPVLISIGLRYVSGIEAHVSIILLFVSVFFAGQFTGKYFYSIYKSRKPI